MNTVAQNAARWALNPLALAICAGIGAPLVAHAGAPLQAEGEFMLRSLDSAAGDASAALVPADPLHAQASVQMLGQVLATEGLRHELRDRLGETRQDRRTSDSEAPALPGAVWARMSQQQVRDNSLGAAQELHGSASALWAGTHLYAYQGGGYFLGGVMAQVQDARVQVRPQAPGTVARGHERTRTVGVYASWFADPDMEQGLHADAWAVLGTSSQQSESSVAASADTVAPAAPVVRRSRAKVRAVSIEVGHALRVRDSGDSALFVEPQLQLSYVDYRIPKIASDPGAVTARAPGSTGALQIRSGVRIYGRASDGLQNKVQPYAAVNHYRNSHGTAAAVGNGPRYAGLPMNVVEAKAGVELQLSPALTAWGSVAMQRGGSYQSREATMGVKLTW